jgi:hypothetical protein
MLSSLCHACILLWGSSSAGFCMCIFADALLYRNAAPDTGMTGSFAGINTPMPKLVCSNTSVIEQKGKTFMIPFTLSTFLVFLAGLLVGVMLTLLGSVLLGTSRPSLSRLEKRAAKRQKRRERNVRSRKPMSPKEKEYYASFRALEEMEHFQNASW